LTSSSSRIFPRVSISNGIPSSVSTRGPQRPADELPRAPRALTFRERRPRRAAWLSQAPAAAVERIRKASFWAPTGRRSEPEGSINGSIPTARWHGSKLTDLENAGLRRFCRALFRTRTGDPLLTIQRQGGTRGQRGEGTGTKAAQEEGIGRRRLNSRARRCPRWCSLSVPFHKSRPAQRHAQATGRSSRAS